MTFRTLCLAFAAMLFTGCSNDLPPKNPVERLGLRETARGRALMEDAAATTNAILGSRNVHRFAGSWQSAPNDAQQAQVIRIYLIDPSSVSAAYSVMVPTACACVFIQPAGLEAWIKDHSTALPQMLAVQPRDIIAFMLLHELGHIEHGDPGQFEAANGEAVNLDQTDQKRQEAAADQVAVDQVAAARSDMNAVTGWLDAQSIQLALTNVSWNTAALRLLNHFGASTLCSRAIFGDAGYSHPNFELRILTANALLANTSESHELLSGFQACRTKPPSPAFSAIPKQP